MLSGPDRRRPRRRQAQTGRGSGRGGEVHRRPVCRHARLSQVLTASAGPEIERLISPARQAAGTGAEVRPPRRAGAGEEARRLLRPWPRRWPRRPRGEDLRGCGSFDTHNPCAICSDPPRDGGALRRRRRRLPLGAGARGATTAATTSSAACSRPWTASVPKPSTSADWSPAPPPRRSPRSSSPPRPPSRARPPPTTYRTAGGVGAAGHKPGEGRPGGRRARLAGRRHHRPGVAGQAAALGMH